VKPTITSRHAGNWVDRGAPAEPVLRRILAHLFDRHDLADGPWLDEHARAVLGMVAADASEVQLTGYLRSVARELGLAPGEPQGTRMVAVALWHAAKAALVRDFAERVLRGEVPVNAPTPERLSDWLAARLLSEDELSAYAADDRPATPDPADEEPRKGV